jgi:cobalt-zinc-cadmium efflux system outer membrane protein
MARRSRTLSIIALAVPIIVAGCATISPKPGFDTVSDLVSARSPGRTVVWNQGTADDQAAAQRVRELLADELTLDATIQIALLDNRALQAVYAQLGIAQADVVQAGLLQNPILSADVRFPTAQGAAIGAAAGLVQEFIAMLQIPLKKRIAAAAFDEATLTTSAAVVDLVTAVKRAYYRLQGAEQLLELRRTVRDATGLSADIARRQHDAGNVTDLDLANESALAEQAGADLARAETEVAEDREELAALMGLWGSDATQWRIASHLPELPSDDGAPDELESLAVSQRLDLAAARQRIRTILLAQRLTRAFRLLPSGAFGVAAEREVDNGVWSIGPSIELPIPIFDQGQATLARQSAELGQRANEHAALEVTVRSQVRRARTRMETSRRLAEQYRTVLLPLRSKVFQQTQLEYNAMLAGVFQLLLAKRDEIDAGASYIEALRDYWLARTELESAVGGELVGDAGQPQQHLGG